MGKRTSAHTGNRSNKYIILCVLKRRIELTSQPLYAFTQYLFFVHSVAGTCNGPGHRRMCVALVSFVEIEKCLRVWFPHSVVRRWVVGLLAPSGKTQKLKNKTMHQYLSWKCYYLLVALFITYYCMLVFMIVCAQIAGYTHAWRQGIPWWKIDIGIFIRGSHTTV